MSYQNLIMMNASIPQSNFDKKKDKDEDDKPVEVDFNDYIKNAMGKKDK